MTKEKSTGNLYSIGQGYGTTNQLKQYLTPGGWKRMLGENLSNSFKERMDLLRDADKEIREEAKTLKTNFKNANVAFKENRYIDVAHWVSEIDQTVQKIVSYGKSVSDIEEKDLLEYYTKTQDADLFKDYFGKKAKIDHVLLKEAALSDFFNKMLGNSFEQTYWKKIKERKLGVQSLVRQSERIVNLVLTSLKKMGDARATGNIGAWVNEVAKIEKGQLTYHEHFKNIYQKHIADLATMMKGKEPTSVFDEKSDVPVDVPADVPVDVPVASEAPIIAPAATPVATNTIPVEQKVNIENKNTAPKEVSRGPGRPTSGDKNRQLNQLEELLKNLKSEPTPTATNVPVDAPVAEVKMPDVAIKQEEKTDAPNSTITVNEDDLEPEEVKITEPVAADVKSEPVKEVITPKVEKPKKTQDPVVKEPENNRPTTTNKKKITMVVLPKGGSDDLNLLGPAVQKAYGNEVVFVSESNGMDRADEYKNKGYEINLKKFDEVKGLIKKGPTKEEILEKLNNPDFINNLKRLGNGDFHFGEILDDPIFSQISSSDKKEIISKLKDIRQKEIETKTPVDTSTSDPALIGLEDDKQDMPVQDEEEIIFTHTGRLEKLLGKSLKDLTEKDSYDLISNSDYLSSLPKTPDGGFDLAVIQKFPEYLILEDESKKYFIGPLNSMSKQMIKDKKKKVAHKQFFDFFEKIAETNDTGLMAMALCKYSEEIDETDPETSAKLLQRAQLLLND